MPGTTSNGRSPPATASSRSRSSAASSWPGSWWNVTSRRTPVAMVMTYLTLLTLFIGPVGLVWYLQGYTDFSEEVLATLTVTSPFSAAFSIPIPSSEDGKPYSPSFLGAATQAVPTGLGVTLPLWAYYLLISPFIVLILNVLTYFAFRWRWWRAGMTI